jgi:hypothetical protein
MKSLLIIPMVLGFALLSAGIAAEPRLGVQVKGEHEYMFVNGDGQKQWYSALELEQIAIDYVKSKKLEFEFEGTQKNIWVHTDGGKVLAEVWFTSPVGKPGLQILIGRKGEVIKHKTIEPKKTG